MHVLDYRTTTSPYPDNLEQSIQKAVQLKRTNDYLGAVKLYLTLFKQEKTIYTAVLLFLYKPVACAGCLKEGIQLLKLGQKIYNMYQNVPLESKEINSGFDEHLTRLNNALTSEIELTHYLTSISGNPKYLLHRKFQEMIREI